MIKYKKLLIISGLLTLMIVSSLPAYSQAPTMRSVFGTDYSEDFALVFDLNIDPQNPDLDGLPLSFQVLEDLSNASNPKVVAEDRNDALDVQFYLAHFKNGGVDSMYLALNKIEFDLKVDLPIIGEKTIGHVNGSAPFQSLMQYFQVLDNDIYKDVFIANTFRGYMAYTTTADDPTIDASDEVYMGYTLVEKNFINYLNTVLENNNANPIPDYGFEQHYTNTDTKQSFGMTYENFFVVWQNVKPTGPKELDTFTDDFDGVVTGGDIVAASVFDYLTFTYTIESTTVNDVTTVVVTTEYDVGPMSLLITRDNTATYGKINELLTEVTDDNSFNTPSFDLVFDFSSIHKDIPSPTITIPSLSFYTGTAVEKRIVASAVLGGVGASGFGLAIVTSTNVVVVGEEINSTKSVTDEQDTVIPLSFGNNKFFETSFAGKSTYDRTLNDGTVETNDVYISIRSLSELNSFMNIGEAAKGYFDAQSVQTYGLAVLSARELNPDKFGTLVDASDLNLKVEQTEYVTFVQMPKWSGLEVTQDPSFTAVAAVPKADGTSDTVGGGGGGNDSTGLPGFEFYAMVLIFLPIIAKRKLSKK